MKKQTLYLECYSGISGDMTVAALLDLGADQSVLLEGLKSLPVDGYEVKIGRRVKSGIDACDFDVILDDFVDNKEYEYQHEHQHEHNHEHKDNTQHMNQHEHVLSHGHEHNHKSSHMHMKDHSTNIHHLHRNLYDINKIIDSSEITSNAKAIAKKAFHIVAVAEAKAHGKPLEEVHFHEVGAIDSIVDIVAAAICLDNLSVGDVIVSKLHEGTGHVTCQHGILPIPVPAVANIVTAHQIPLEITSVKGELVTPTGAALVAAIRTKEILPKSFQIKKIGLGAGKREYPQASILRAMLIEDTSHVAQTSPSISSSGYKEDKVWVLETNLDDCSGEEMSMVMDLLFENGAKDVYFTSIYMKKNRPAYLLGVICSEDVITQLESIIFTHTTSIGIRKREEIRTILERVVVTISTPYGDALVKVCSYGDHQFYYPEYKSIQVLCKHSNMDYRSMYSLVQTLAQKNA